MPSLKIAALINFSNGDKGVVDWNGNLHRSSNVKKFIWGGSPYNMRGKVHASMRDKFYKVEVSTNSVCVL